MSVPPPAEPLPPLTANHNLLNRLINCIEDEILPHTEIEVPKGNKVFGAAILLDEVSTTCSDDDNLDEDENQRKQKKKDSEKWPLVIAKSNAELTKCSLYHGEVHCIHAYGTELSPENKPTPDQCIFLSTHEPCCMCISSIVWSGFQKVYYLFGYQDTKDQGIPHDINIMHELWGVPTYRKRNQFVSTASIVDLVDALDNNKEKEELKIRLERLFRRYNTLSKQYHSEKKTNSHDGARGGDSKIVFD
jgi:tRNA(Arg) A34 adenosine deaminase TadA